MAEIQRRDLVYRSLETLELQDRPADFSLLQDLVNRHVSNYAFSSMGVRLGDELPLDFVSLFERIVVCRRGGYCFEQNGLLYEVLEELGFSPRLILARVIYNQYNQDTHPGLTHRISIVECDGRPYVLDVGFGPDGPAVPVPLTGPQTGDRHKVYRVEQRDGGEYHMQVLKEGGFYSLYRFELTRYGMSDCKLGHFYSHRHPDASFVNHLVVSRILAGETRSLRDLEYRVITETGVDTKHIVNHRQLMQVLVEAFALELTPAESRRLFEQLDKPGDLEP